METKKAITLLNNHREFTQYSLMGKEIDQVIALLKRGEAYKKMWKELEEKDIDYKTDSPYVNDTMYYIEQKYLKEANPDEANNKRSAVK